MKSVDVLLAEANSLSSVPAAGNILLILAAVILVVALKMLGQALHPLREVLRAVAAAAGMTLLVILALVLIIVSLAVRT
ncbi:hypothetical protein [Actinoplanes sp. NPDC026670]|uniref:hypothetical protein n=1 Tax=Actinoplanes sp. NPDC026670 TaxID=3154700 RepID=UPI0033ED8C11